jgi:hypothetical protein
VNKIKELVRFLNDKGIPLPMIRIDGKASFTGTLTFLSFTTALFGQIGKVAQVLGEVDLSEARNLFIVALSAHLGILVPQLLTSKTKTGEGESVEKVD